MLFSNENFQNLDGSFASSLLGEHEDLYYGVDISQKQNLPYYVIELDSAVLLDAKEEESIVAQEAAGLNDDGSEISQNQTSGIQIS